MKNKNAGISRLWGLLLGLSVLFLVLSCGGGGGGGTGGENEPPTVHLQANPSTGANPLEVHFTASVTDPEGDLILGCEFDFGDGSPVYSTSSTSATHTYSAVGTYNAKVRCEDEENNWSDWSQPIQITVEGSATDTWSVFFTEENAPIAQPDSAALSTNGDLFIANGVKGSVFLVDPNSGAVMKSVKVSDKTLVVEKVLPLSSGTVVSFFDSQSNESIVVLYDTELNEVWNISLPSEITGLAASSDGRLFYCGGKSDGNGYVYGELNPQTGEKVWENTIDKIYSGADDCAVAPYGNKEYLYVAGTAGQVELYQIDPSTHQVVRSWHNEDQDVFSYFTVDIDYLPSKGDIVVTATMMTINQTYRVELFSLDTLLHPLHTASLPFSAFHYSTAPSGDGALLIAGYTSDGTDVNGFLSRYDVSTNALSWTKQYGGSGTALPFCNGSDVVYFVVSAPNGYIYLGGTTASTDFPTADGSTHNASTTGEIYFLLKLKPDGTY